MPRSFVAVVALLLCSGCSILNSVRVHGRTGDAKDIGSRTPVSLGSSGKTHASSLDTRRVCRSGPRPSGWIAISYETSASECPRVGDAGGRDDYNVATIARYDTQPLGQTIEVCADQSTPTGWTDDHDDDRVGDACPGASKDGTSATKVIRRVN